MDTKHIFAELDRLETCFAKGGSAGLFNVSQLLKVVRQLAEVVADMQSKGESAQTQNQTH